MDDTEGKMNTGHGKKLLNPFAVKMAKKRSLVERQLETNMTALITLPVTVADGLSTSRYGRARRIKNGDDINSTQLLKSPTLENTPVKKSPVRQSTANKSDPIAFKIDTSKKAFENSLDKIDKIYEENKNLSRFNMKNDVKNSATKSPKVYIQKDLIQNRDDDDDIILIKDLFSPKSTSKSTPQSNRKRMKLLQSTEKPQSSSKKQNGHIACLNVENASVVKALDFDENKTDIIRKQDEDDNKKSDDYKSDKKKKKDETDLKPAPNDLFEIEAASMYQVGDLAWARMGTFPFWPCIITRDPANNMFVRRKLFGRVVHYILHVTFFADNGRRSWVVDNMLRNYKGLNEFISTRDKFTAEEKKKDPRLYAAFFISDKKQSLWNMSVEEAEMINREPKRTRVDVFQDALFKSRESKKLKSGKVSSRTDSDVSLSESLYDSLFSEDDSKDYSIRTRNRTKNRSLDVSEIVTACLDNMAAKTGNIKIQRQSHMDRWLQKAKSKTPEKVKTKNNQTPVKDTFVFPKTEPIDNHATPIAQAVKLKIHNNSPRDEKTVKNDKKRKLPPKEVKITKVYGLRRSYESQNSFIQESENKSLVDDSDTVANLHSTRNIPTKKEVANIAENNLNSNEQPKQNLINNIHVTNVSDDNCTTENNNQIIDKKISTPEAMSEDVHLVTIEIKPEVMDVDVNQEHDVKVVANPSTATEMDLVLDNAVKIEKESSVTDFETVNGAVESEMISTNTLNGVSPVKTESPIETSVSNESDTNSTQEIIDIANESTIIPEKKSSPLKNNEMVLIPENNTLTDDESNSVTSSDESKRRSVDREYNKGNRTLSKQIKVDLLGILDETKTLIKDDVLNSTDKPHTSVANDISVEKTDEQIENQMSFDEIAEESTTEKSLLNQSGDSASILRIDDEIIDSIEKSVDNLLPNGSGLSPKNSKAEGIIEDNFESSEKQVNENSNKCDSANNFLDDSRNIDCVDSAIVKTKNFFRAEVMNKPPDLIPCKKVIEIDQCNSDYAEDSDDEPSPEFEPLEDEIKEDFRQHMICIESNITDKKDDAQLAKVCNDIAELEESKFKLNDIKSNIDKISHVQNVKETNTTLNDEQILSELSFESEQLESSSTTAGSKSKEVKAEILESIADPKNSVESNLKSPPGKKRHNLSLKKDKLKTEDVNECETSMVNENTINPMYKTIDQIEEIIKSKPKRLPIENGEVCIPGIVNSEFKKEIDTPEIEDIDFDIDNASISSEDSEVSLPHNNIPARRSLRSKPDRKVGLEDPDFLAYMELRQDDLMEEHPDLTRDDIVLYLYKTYTYSKNLQPEVKLEESPLKVNPPNEQETPRKKSKKHVQPKNTIENFFREKVNNSTRIERERSNKAGSSVKKEQVTPKRETLLVSPVDSGLGNSKDSNEVYTPVSRRRNRSITLKDLTEVTKEIKTELINETNKSSSPNTPKRLRKKTISPRVLGSESKRTRKIYDSMDNRVPVVVISPESNLTKKIDNSDSESNLTKKMDKRVPVVVISPMKEHKTIKGDPESLPCDNKEDKTKDENIIFAQNKQEENHETQPVIVVEMKHEDTEPESMDSESEVPLRQLRSKVQQEKQLNTLNKEILQLKDEVEDTTSVSSDNEPLLIKPKKNKTVEGSYDDPEFLKYLEMKQDALMDENPHLSQNEITAYLYKTWIYEKDSKSEIRKNDEIESSNLVKGVNPEPVAPQRKARRKPKVEKVEIDEIIPKEKPKRKTLSHYYNEELLSDVEEELEVFEIFKTKKTAITVVSKPDSPKKERQTDTTSEEVLNKDVEDICEEINTLDDVELYFKQLVSPKPSVFKGLVREKVCGICEDISNLIKCKGCHEMFHYECVNRVVEVTDTDKPCVTRGRKKKKKPLNGRKSNEEHHDISEESISIEESESLMVDAVTFESEFEVKMKEIMEKESDINYDSYSSDDGIDWTDSIPGKCELVDVKLKKKTPPIDISNFKCNNCSKYDRPICFVCKSAISKTGVKIRQKCNVAHCHSYYHLECLDHWPQTQFNAGEWSRTKTDTFKQEALTCPRHVCHTCVSDDPRGCKTRFSGDKLAKCVRCPATYHSFNKCLPAGTQILTASFIICPRHYEHRPGKVPCHVNTGWCFICALGGSLICCEYCPTSFHAECLNIKPPEGNYMCEDCETGRLPLYGEMVWVKLGHYRWWPGVVLHPSEIPDNIMAVKHGLGEFVVRFFGQYDHYWVNRGRVFPYQEGDSGRVSGQKSKIDAAFTTAIEHAQRAYEILKNAEPDDDESLEINSSLLPPHYVKLKSNKPTGSLLGRKIEDPSLSLTQCECNPADIEPCGPNSQCLNRVLLTECGPTCRAGERCNNRAFEKRQYPKLTPYRASHRGWGLKTLDDIRAGQFVIEYVGELIDEEEFQRRMKRKHEIRDENFYFLTLDKERMIDAGPKGNLARFMNHCCEPNCETQKWTVLGDVRVGLFAIDDIKANSEVTFNYNLECTGIEKKRCMCGAKRCSGYIGAKPKQLDESLRKKHGMTGKRKYTKRKEREDSPSASKSKTKKPLGRPRKEKTPKELTEIEKDLLIIQSATTTNSDESRPPSVDEKKIDSNTTQNDKNSNNESKEFSEIEETNAIEPLKLNGVISNKDKVLKTKLDPNTTEEDRILNGIEPKLQKKMNSIPLKVSIESKALKRKASNTVDIKSEPSAKRLKSDKRIEVGD